MVSSKAFAVPLLFAMLLPALPLLQFSAGGAQDAPVQHLAAVPVVVVSEPQAAAVPSVVIPPVVPLPGDNGILFPLPDGNGILFPVPEIPPLKPIPDLFICRDSDGGKNYFRFGMANGRDPANRQYVGTFDFNDFCADANTLNEYFCVADWVHSERVGCAKGCRAGACLGEPGPDANYCCPAGQGCVIAGVCEPDGTIKCTMRAGQNMLIRDFNSACNITLDVENGGAMGWLRLENDRILGGQNFSVNTGNIFTAGGKNIGVILLNCENTHVRAGNILTQGESSNGVFLGDSSNNNLSFGSIVTRGLYSDGITFLSFCLNNYVVSGAIQTNGGGDGISIMADSNSNSIFAGNITAWKSRGINFDGGVSNNAVHAGNIQAIGEKAEGVKFGGALNNTVLAKDVNAGGWGIVSSAYMFESLGNLVCANEVSASEGACVLYGAATLTGCENGTPIPNCANSDRNCSECGAGTSCSRT
ncbi:MAG: hypothetical protein V1676_02480 [Candidatus Diapherotrites archaeon]